MTTTTINKAELLSAALSAVAEDRDVKAHGLNAAADDVCEALEPAVRALRVEDSNDSGCYNVPTYALPYLINADPSGLSDEEIAAIDEWYAGLEVEGLSFTLDVVDSQAAPYFSNCPAFGLPAECERVAVTYFPDL